jgi:hypothetical protein
MGVIDQITHLLTCTKCGASESVTIVQYGSAYSGGNWQPGKPMSQFTVTWGAGDGFTGPCITLATCNTCGSTPEVSTS